VRAREKGRAGARDVRPLDRPAVQPRPATIGAAHVCTSKPSVPNSERIGFRDFARNEKGRGKTLEKRRKSRGTPLASLSGMEHRDPRRMIVRDCGGDLVATTPLSDPAQRETYRLRVRTRSLEGLVATLTSRGHRVLAAEGGRPRTRYEG